MWRPFGMTGSTFKWPTEKTPHKKKEKTGAGESATLSVGTAKNALLERAPNPPHATTPWRELYGEKRPQNGQDQQRAGA